MTDGRNARSSIRVAFADPQPVDWNRNTRQSTRVALATSSLTVEARAAQLQVRVLEQNTGVGPAQVAQFTVRALVSNANDARVARVSERALTTGTPAAQVARIDTRVVSTGQPAARLARVSVRAVTRLNITEGQVARVSVRAVTTLGAPAKRGFSRILRVGNKLS